MAAGTIEIVSNDSGSGYCKFADGTLVCWVFYAYKNQALTTAWGSMYYSQQLVLPDWPVAFYGTPYVLTSLQGGGEALLGRVTNVTTAKAGALYAYSPVSQSSVTLGVNAVGIGRWR